MKRKLYKCDHCGHSVSIRTEIKKGEHKGLKVCPGCSNSISGPSKKIGRQYPKQVLLKSGKKKDVSECIGEYYEYHISKARKSEESNLAISATSVNICHIWPKNRHDSVKCHHSNYVYLTWEEHALLDRLLDYHDWPELERMFPNSWPDICQRAAEIYPLIKEKTKFKTLFEEYLTKSGLL